MKLRRAAWIAAPLVALGLLFLLLTCENGCTYPWVSPPDEGGAEDESPAPPSNEAPIALFDVSNPRPEPGEAVRLDGTYSRDPDGIVVSWRWAIAALGIQTAPIVTQSWSQVGSYRVALTVQDNEGAYSAETAYTVVVQEADPPPCDSGGGTCP